jgi:hypothetical protein
MTHVVTDHAAEDFLFSLFLYLSRSVLTRGKPVVSHHWFWRGCWAKLTCQNLAWPSYNSRDGRVKLWHVDLVPMTRNCDGRSPSRPLYFLRVPPHPETNRRFSNTPFFINRQMRRSSDGRQKKIKIIVNERPWPSFDLLFFFTTSF